MFCVAEVSQIPSVHRNVPVLFPQLRFGVGALPDGIRAEVPVFLGLTDKEGHEFLEHLGLDVQQEWSTFVAGGHLAMGTWVLDNEIDIMHDFLQVLCDVVRSRHVHRACPIATGTCRGHFGIVGVILESFFLDLVGVVVPVARHSGKVFLQAGVVRNKCHKLIYGAGI